MIIIFIIAQTFIIYLWGMVFSPFLNYGMYSEVMKIEDSYNVFKVEVNGKQLHAKDFSAQKWDNIILPLNWYSSINKSNDLYRTDIKRLMSKVGFSTNEKNFLQNCNQIDFHNWYLQYLQKISHEKINTVSCKSQVYHFSNGHLQPTDSTLSFADLCN